MTVNINHDLRVVDGGTLYMPPWEEGNDNWGNLKRPSVYLATTLQEYPTGTIWRHGLRTFIYTQLDATYYGEAGTAAILAGYTVESCSEILTLANLVISGASGASTCVLDLEDGHTVDCYAGGFIGIVGSAGDRATVGRVCGYQIISNTVANSASDYQSTFTLDGVLPRALLTSDDVVLAEHPYAKVRHPIAGPYGMTVGVLMQTSASAKFIWVQTGGPCNIVLTGATLEGANDYEVPVYAFNGWMNKCTDTASTIMSIELVTCQRVGNSYANTNVDGPTTGGTPTDDTVASAVWLDIFN